MKRYGHFERQYSVSYEEEGQVYNAYTGDSYTEAETEYTQKCIYWSKVWLTAIDRLVVRSTEGL